MGFSLASTMLFVRILAWLRLDFFWLDSAGFRLDSGLISAGWWLDLGWILDFRLLFTRILVFSGLSEALIAL